MEFVSQEGTLTWVTRVTMRSLNSKPGMLTQLTAEKKDFKEVQCASKGDKEKYLLLKQNLKALDLTEGG